MMDAIGGGPNWAEIVSAVGAALAGGGVLLAVRQLSESKRDRHVQVITDFGRRWDEDKMAEAREALLPFDDVKLAEKIGECLAHPADSDLYLFLRVPNFFEDLALVVEFGSIDVELVSRAFRSLVLSEWKYWKPAITKFREGLDQAAYSQFESLATVLEATEAK
jgi:Domain of unknown function (DUF4760)